MTQQLQVVEYSNQRILTTQQIAEAYGTDANNLYKNFQNNKDRYTPGKHYYCLEGEELNQFLTLHLTIFQAQNLSKIRILYLWTEKGALMHAKSLNTDQAWTVYEELVDSYFRPRPTINPLMEIERMRRELTALKRSIVPPQPRKRLDTPLTPEEERNMVLHYLDRRWALYGEGSSATDIANFATRLTRETIILRLDELVEAGILVKWHTSHTTRYKRAPGQQTTKPQN